ncbi:MAG: DUF1499 domain-containing protein [Burkholderiales bacterium]|nr:MAG: DUF1499 domain-containing protein [Betaproteobacteria bacterium]TAG79967.1 MAG: DUF1499 domain-containing protein [Burkholderiales bacterium]
MWFAGRPSTLGVHDGKLSGPKKRTPNSVVSEGIEPTHPAYIAPIAFTGDPRAAMAKLLTVLQAMKDVTLVKAEETYVYAEFRTPKMRYVDDFEARLDASASLIHVRSASRLGKRDFNVNRNRVEAIRKRFTESI